MAGLAGEHQRREPGELGVDPLQLALVGPHRLLGGRAGTATNRVPTRSSGSPVPRHQRKAFRPRLGPCPRSDSESSCPRPRRAAAWRATARRVEDLGYSTLFIPDHFEDQFGPLVALTVAAEATTTLRVGSLVFGNDYRHPVVLAKEVATLDVFSEGRVEFGLGAGWMTSDYEQSGIAADPAGVRISRMAESLAVLKALWSTGEATYQGEYYRITGSPGVARTRPAAPSADHHRRRRAAGAGHRRP